MNISFKNNQYNKINNNKYYILIKNNYNVRISISNNNNNKFKMILERLIKIIIYKLKSKKINNVKLFLKR